MLSNCRNIGNPFHKCSQFCHEYAEAAHTDSFIPILEVPVTPMPVSTLAERLRMQAELIDNFRLTHPPLSHDMVNVVSHDMVNVVVTAVARDPSLLLPSMDSMDDSMDVTASYQVSQLPLPMDATVTVPGPPPTFAPTSLVRILTHNSTWTKGSAR